MRELHVVALSEDGRHAVLATSPDASRGGFRLVLNGRLAAAMRGDLPRVGEQAPREPSLTPKDIQARLRAGESPDEIARSAGMPLARIERFAGPVLSELARMIDSAQAAHVVRDRRGRSVLPLGAAVTAALEQVSGLRPETIEWATRRAADGRWVVTVAWVSRARHRTASWVYDPVAHHLTPSDPASAELGHATDAVAQRPAAAPAKAGAPAKARAKPSKAAAKPAKPVEAEAPAQTEVPAQAAEPDQVAAAEVVEPAAEPVAEPVAAPAAEMPAAELRTAPALSVVPNQMTGHSIPSRAIIPREPRREGARARASVPGWADVLLSTSPREEAPHADS